MIPGPFTCLPGVPGRIGGIIAMSYIDCTRLWVTLSL